MSARPQVDTVLVIRARDEATKAVTAIGSALEQLIGTQKRVAAGSETAATGMQQILGVLASLDKAYSKTAQAGDAGAEALERQNRAIAASKAQYASLEAQQRGAARAADQLRVALVDALINDGNADVIRAQLVEVTSEMKHLESEAGKLQRTIAQQEVGYTRAASGKGILSAVGVAVPTPVPANHTGGIAGQNTSGTRLLNPDVFAAAARFHTGGIAGLRPDEVPIIAQKGEEILTRGDARHRANGGLGGGGVPVNLKVVNAIDAGDFVSKGLDSGVGGKALMNYIRANSGAIKQAIG